MSRILLNTKIWLLMLLWGVVSSVYAQDDDFTTWTKFKVNHKIDSRFSVSGDVELRTKDDMNKWDRWGLTVGGNYRAYSFLKLGVAYETHLRDLGDSGWKFRHRYHLSATASFRYLNSEIAASTFFCRLRKQTILPKVLMLFRIRFVRLNA